MERIETCKENIGFLTLRRCEKPAVATCSLCKKPICLEHCPALPSGQVACTTCSRQPQAAQQTQQPGAPRTRQDGSNDYYDPYYSSYHFSDYHPYSVHDRFNEKDYSAFNGGAGIESSAEAGFEGS
jgi:hypothetical protein